MSRGQTRGRGHLGRERPLAERAETGSVRLAGVPARAAGGRSRLERRRDRRDLVAARRERARGVRPRREAVVDLGLTRDCVHCGFCLPTCPTYDLWHEEMDSPRGRIWLMQEVLEGRASLNAVAKHFDRCLGCMACLTSCPSGVKYDRLIELTRERVEEEVARPLSQRALRLMAFAVLPRPKLMRVALPFSRLAPFRAFRELAPPWREPVAPPRETPAVGERRARVGLLTGCVQSVLFGEVNRAT